MKFGAVITGGVGGVLGVLWGLILIFMTKVIYDDGEFIDPHWMAIYTGMMVTGAVAGLAGSVAVARGRLLPATVAFIIAMLMTIGAILPGFGFAWSGFSGFGAAFFFLAVLIPVAVETVLFLGSLLFIMYSKAR